MSNIEVSSRQLEQPMGSIMISLRPFFFLLATALASGAAHADVPCAGACYLHRSGEPAFIPMATPLDAHRVTKYNELQLDKNTIMDVAQANPAAAAAMIVFSDASTKTGLSILGGKMSTSRRITPRAVALALQSVDQPTFESATENLPDGATSAETERKGRKLNEHTLEVTFSTSLLDDEQLSIGSIFKSVKLIFNDAKPSRLVSWERVE